MIVNITVNANIEHPFILFVRMLTMFIIRVSTRKILCCLWNTKYNKPKTNTLFIAYTFFNNYVVIYLI